MSAVDHAFVKAIYTIKALSRGPSMLGRPSEGRRIELYGLYKQATEGDIEGLLPRPQGNSPQVVASRKKWDAWKSQEGVSKYEAKRRYVGLLLDTMQELNPDAITQQPALRELSIAYSQTTQPQKPQTYSEFGLSERHSDIDPADSVSNWRHDVSWQLESITEELRSREDQRVGKSQPASAKAWLLFLRLVLGKLYGLVQRVVTDLAFLLVLIFTIRLIRKNTIYMPKYLRSTLLAIGRIFTSSAKDLGIHIHVTD